MQCATSVSHAPPSPALNFADLPATLAPPQLLSVTATRAPPLCLMLPAVFCFSCPFCPIPPPPTPSLPLPSPAPHATQTEASLSATWGSVNGKGVMNVTGPTNDLMASECDEHW